MGTRRQITEYLAVDLEKELWMCSHCNKELGSARDNYKKFTLLYDRDPRTIHNPVVERFPNGLSYSPDPDWCRIIEFCCPECGTLIEVEYLPPGHPITHDIELDIDSLKARYLTKGR